MKVFASSSAHVRLATQDDHTALTKFCRDNPDYDVFLTGRLPHENEWVEDFLTDLPPIEFNWTATHKLIAYLIDDSTNIAAIIDVTEDMIGKGVGHIGSFQVAQKLHGTGLAQDLYSALERWLASHGARVIRLGVLDGNERGMAFWTRLGYRQTRVRMGTAPTGKQHFSRVMYKPLLPMSVSEYRILVPRDHPEAA